ncbi:MAG: thioredoxin domain-containing protein [Pseudomonadota bacterium]
MALVLWSLLTACDSVGESPEVRILADGATGLSTSSGEIVVRVLRLPPEGAERFALIVGLHGYGMDEQQIAALVKIEPSTPHTYVAIRGFEALEPGSYAWFPVSSGAGPVIDSNAIIEASDRLFRGIDAVTAWLGTDPERVYLVGFGQGATMTLSAAFLRPSDAAGYVGFAGRLPAIDATVVSDVSAPVLIGHGTRDPSVRAEDTDLAVSRLIEVGRRVELNVYSVPHVVSAAGRRDIATWIDARERGQEMTASPPPPLSAVGSAVAKSQGSAGALVDSVLRRAVSRGGVSGNPKGAITIYKFFDYNCPSCRVAHRELPNLLAAYPNVRLVAVDVPVFGEGSVRATALTFSIDNPAQYKAVYADLLASNDRIGAHQAIESIRQHVGVLVDDMNIDPVVEAHLGEIQNNMAALDILGIVGTPGFLIDADDVRTKHIGWDPHVLRAYLKSLSE